MRLHDLRGRTFGRLLVIERAPHCENRPHWRCRCECSQVVVISAKHLRNNNTRSCGCLKRETTRDRNMKHGLTIGKNRPPCYRIWANAKSRCFDRNNPAFSHYGGRGITMCAEWANDFLAFVRDMGPRPSSAHSLDRVNNDGNYEPTNCRWATRIEQLNNTRRNRAIVVRGEHIKSIAIASQIFGVNYRWLRDRIARGMSPERAIGHD